MHKLLMSFLLIICFGSLQAQTEVSGTISGETWTQAESPYLVVGDIQVAQLEIEQGVTVKFAGNYVFEVAGILTAIGTAQENIIFTTDSAVAGWQGVRFQDVMPGSELSYCIIEKSLNRGMRIINSFPIVKHCIIRDNAGSTGAGIYVSLAISGELIFTDCQIIENNSSSHGGGVYVNADSGSVSFVECNIDDNYAYATNTTVYGGGAYINGEVEFIDCTLNNNYVYGNDTVPGGSSSGRGGGLCFGGGELYILRTSIQGNTSRGYAIGGFSGNAGYAYGGGIYSGSDNLTLLNSILHNNTATSSHGSYGGGIYSNNGTINMSNCTVIENNLHAIYNNSADINIRNSIVYFNNNDGAQFAGSRLVNYSDVQGGEEGEGNINYNPVIDINACVRIIGGSPCIDMGDPDISYNDVCFPPSYDTERNDMGAHGGPLACGSADTCLITDVISDSELLLPSMILQQNYPNPFNPTTVIKFNISSKLHVELTVFNSMGQTVKRLIDSELPAGEHSVSWDGTNQIDKRVATGVYFYKISAGDYATVKKMILLK